MNNLLVIGIVISVCFMLIGCAAKFSREDFLEEYNSNTKIYILDVRTQGEFEQGHVPGAVNINVFVLPFRMEEITGDEDEPIVVYCAHGLRAGLAGFFLRLAGYKNVLHLEGDWVKWQKAGLPAEMSPKKPDEINED